MTDADSKPVLVIVGGVPGAGKSTVAELIADRLGAERLRSDEIRKELFEPQRDLSVGIVVVLFAPCGGRFVTGVALCARKLRIRPARTVQTLPVRTPVWRSHDRNRRDPRGSADGFSPQDRLDALAILAGEIE